MGPGRDLRTGRFDAALIGARLEKRFRQSRALRSVVRWGRKRSLWLWPFGRACCGDEPIRALLEHADLVSGGVEVAPSWRQADVLVVSGRLTLKSLPWLLEIATEMPEPKWILSLGHDSREDHPVIYADAGDVSESLVVDIRVPGCPPSPESLLEGVSEIRRLIDSREQAEA